MTFPPGPVFGVWVTNELVAAFVHEPDAQAYRDVLVRRILDEANDLDGHLVERLVRVALTRDVRADAVATRSPGPNLTSHQPVSSPLRAQPQPGPEPGQPHVEDAP